MVCVHKNYNEFRDDLLQGLEDLPTEATGQQILLLFRIDKLNRFKSENMDAARNLLARHAQTKPPPAHSDVMAVSGGKPKL